MYFQPKIRVEIESQQKWVFNLVNECEITLDSNSLTDTCTLKLPKKVKWRDENTIPLRRGDTVSVWLGYDDKLQLAFKGYIRNINCDVPVVIECEDEMYRLKYKQCKKLSYKSVTIEKLLKDQDIGVPIKVFGEQNIGQYRVTSDTIASLLGSLSRNGIRSFFKLNDAGDPELYCGVIFPPAGGVKQSFKKHVSIITDSLEQQRAEDIRLFVKAISLMPDNKKITAEVGDADGEKRTIHTYNKSKVELEAWAKQEVKRLKVDGLSGSFTTFGFRLVNKMDNIMVEIDDNKGAYQVTKNVITFGVGGLRQNITIGGRML